MPSPFDQGTDASGVTPPAGGAAARGWLSGIYAKLISSIAVTTLNLPVIDKSGTTSATINTATTAIAANANRQGWSLQNIHASATMWISEVGAATTAQPSRPLLAGQIYESPRGGQGSALISVISNVASVPYVGREW